MLQVMHINYSAKKTALWLSGRNAGIIEDMETELSTMTMFYLRLFISQRALMLCCLVSSNLPVMVWIFGGGFLVGGSMGANFLNNYLYSGQEIADKGNVIVVTLGYRVGTLGFLSTGETDMPGRLA